MKKQNQNKKENKKLSVPLLIFLIAVYSLVIYFASEESYSKMPEEKLPICLYSNQAGDNLRKTYVEAILEAKESITCLIYSFTDEEIIAAFKKKADAGVDITVISDPVATQNIHERLGPKIKVVPIRQKGLMHNKLLAIDHKVSLIGSANLTRDSLSMHANLVMGIYSPAVALAIEAKAKSLAEKGKKIEPLFIKTSTQTLDLSFLPDDAQGLYKVLQLLKSAQKSIKVAMFTFTHPALIDALVAAHKRGVDVTVVLDRDSSRQTSNHAFRCFGQEKMNILTSNRVGLLHEKIAIIDDTTLIMGSANWTKAAFGTNSENICILTNLQPVQLDKLNRFWATTLQETSTL